MQAQQQVLAMAVQAQGRWAPHAPAAANMTPHQMQMQQAILAQQQAAATCTCPCPCPCACVEYAYTHVRTLLLPPALPRGTPGTLQAQAIA
eukprot:scaffold1916_cov52-Phaeocystis_antarctica.AAC.1